MNAKTVTYLLVLAGFLYCAAPLGTALAANHGAGISMYHESAFTSYVEKDMKKLDKLYLQFRANSGVSGAKAEKARQAYFETVRGLLKHMNARFDQVDPKTGGALSPTETFVSVHALTMLVDMLTDAQMQQTAPHPYNP